MTAKKTPAAPRKALAADPRGAAKPAAAAKPADTPHAEAAANIAAGVGQDGAVKRRETTADKAKARGEELVDVTVPVAFKFTRDDHSMVDYPAGSYKMPRAHAEDSFAQAHGVTIGK